MRCVKLQVLKVLIQVHAPPNLEFPLRLSQNKLQFETKYLIIILKTIVFIIFFKTIVRFQKHYDWNENCDYTLRQLCSVAVLRGVDVVLLCIALCVCVCRACVCRACVCWCLLSSVGSSLFVLSVVSFGNAQLTNGQFQDATKVNDEWRCFSPQGTSGESQSLQF